ncbi:MAG TPA: type II toxin-antitoxin system VapC family toxin [Thermoanaerobaculia bacterium]
MPGEVLYFDSSALVKLIVPEGESAALLALLPRYKRHVSSALASVEVKRALHRASAGEASEKRANQVLAGLNLLEIDERVLADAADLEPFSLRTLDALHLASALSLGDQLAAMVVYDVRLAAAAQQRGLPVLAPS